MAPKNKSWYSRNKDTALKRSKEWRKSNVDKYKAIVRRQRKRYKLRALSLVGGAFCVGCGETDLACLSIDHINGDGAQDRKKARNRGGTQMYLELISGRRGVVGLRCLCMNCQYRAITYGPNPDIWEEKRKDLEEDISYD